MTNWVRQELGFFFSVWKWEKKNVARHTNLYSDHLKWDFNKCPRDDEKGGKKYYIDSEEKRLGGCATMISNA